MVQVRVKHKSKADDDALSGFFQTLTFPLRLADEETLPLPLEPSTIYFEDPEYNRLLASPSAHASTTIKIEQDNKEPVSHAVRLSADRREYNANGRLSLRYDWDDDRIEGTAMLELKRVSKDGVVSTLKPAGILSMKVGELFQISLDQLTEKSVESEDFQPVRFETDDALRLTMTLNDDNGPGLPGKAVGKEEVRQARQVELTVDIVSRPATPTPEAGYALLRSFDEENGAVDCARFAWGPEPQRIELVCPKDLQTELVRRRAVFRWVDCVRPGSVSGYAIQKFTHGGSTHFPSFSNAG